MKHYTINLDQATQAFQEGAIWQGVEEDTNPRPTKKMAKQCGLMVRLALEFFGEDICKEFSTEIFPSSFSNFSEQFGHSLAMELFGTGCGFRDHGNAQVFKTLDKKCDELMKKIGIYQLELSQYRGWVEIYQTPFDFKNDPFKIYKVDRRGTKTLYKVCLGTRILAHLTNTENANDLRERAICNWILHGNPATKVM